jgi:hypothetical protein
MTDYDTPPNAREGAPPNTQSAPFPELLKALVDKLSYRPGWTFDLHHFDRGQGSKGLTLRASVAPSRAPVWS